MQASLMPRMSQIAGRAGSQQARGAAAVVRPGRVAGGSSGSGRRAAQVGARSVPDGRAPAAQQQPVLDVAKVAELFASQPMDDELRPKLERIARVLGVTLGEAKSLGFKKRALLELDEAELQSRLEQVASIVGVPLEQAKRMAAIQPNLLLEPKRNADALALGLRAICYELDCPKDEAVALITNNRSILHGREMHLSVADIAHLAMLRQPTGRIVD